MQQLVRNWLNGSQEYYTGLAMLKRCKVADDVLLNLLAKGANDFNKKKLLELLLQYYQTNKTPENDYKPTITRPNEVGPIRESSSKLNEHLPSSAKPSNPLVESNEQNTKDYSQTTLYKACITEADNYYKDMMNQRAVLFAGLRSLQPYEDPNRPDLVQTRRKSSIDIALMAQRSSKLYDTADYVKKNGRLPHDEKQEEESDVDAIPDILIKQKLDNLRKTMSKIRGKEQTPERIELLAQHSITLEKLEARWQLLKLEK